jgi:capsular polysaccharide biosynthesis protein
MKSLLLKERTEARRKPLNLEQEDNHVFDHELTKILKPVHLSEIKNVIILKDIVYKFLKFYEQDCFVEKLSLTSKLKRLTLFFSYKAKHNSGIWIIDNWSTTYFHWFADALPRLWAAKNYIKGHKVLLPYKYKNLRHVTESLTILGIEYVFFNPLKKVSVKDLLLPEHVADTGNFNSEVMQGLRTQFIKKYSPAEPFRLTYISRRKASFRKLINENDLESLLKRFGFEIIVCEDMNLSDQIKILSETKILLGVHGGGLTNMLFMNTQSKILELRAEGDTHNNCYFLLASAMGVDYYYIKCKSTSSWIQTSDFVADIEKVQSLLESLMSAKPGSIGHSEKSKDILVD